MSVGLEICFSVVKEKILSRTDALVVFVHWELISEGKKCVGIDEAWPDSKEQGSELLPAKWNQNQEVYTLRYVSDNNERFLLKIVKSDQFVLISIINVTKNKAAGTSLKIDDYISENYQEYSSAYKQVKEMKQNLSRMFMEIEEEKIQTTSSLGSQEEKHPSDPLRSNIFRQIQNPLRVGPENPLSVGEGDLDPLGRKEGGMLMDLRRFPRVGGHPSGLPRDAVPPGARFDPFGPAGLPSRQFGPDPDHFPPPGSSDMFM